MNHVMTRLITGFIVLFWLVMNGLMVQTEFFKQPLFTLDLPPNYVIQTMFTHGQSSYLNVLQSGESIGLLKLSPTRSRTPQGTYVNHLQFETSLNLPFQTTKERIQSNGFFELKPDLSILKLAIRTSLPKQKIEATLAFNAAENHFLMTLLTPGHALRKWEGKPEEILTIPELRAYGLNVISLNQLQTQLGTSHIHATKTLLKMNGNAVEVFVLRIQHSASLESSIYFSQLGQVLKIETATGQRLLSEGVDE